MRKPKISVKKGIGDKGAVIHGPQEIVFILEVEINRFLMFLAIISQRIDILFPLADHFHRMCSQLPIMVE